MVIQVGAHDRDFAYNFVSWGKGVLRHVSVPLK